VLIPCRSPRKTVYYYTQKSFICRWTQCGRQCSVREKHIEKHASLPLRCAYQGLLDELPTPLILTKSIGCHESYRSSSQLLKHFRAKHSNTAVKPQARPFPTKARPLAPLPNENLPSYLIVTTPVIPISISQERHSEIGPLVRSGYPVCQLLLNLRHNRF